MSTIRERRGVAQFGSALALGARCRRFESCLPDASVTSPQLAFDPLNPDLATGHFGVFWCFSGLRARDGRDL